MSDPPVTSWREFWERSNHLYLGERYLAAHFDRVARDILSLQPTSDAVILDYGCGDTLKADVVANRVALLYLYDAAVQVQSKLKHRFSQQARIKVLNDTTLAALPQSSLDLIIVNSVVQYLTVAEFGELLAHSRKLLKSSGMLVLADVIPPGNMLAKDVFALLSLAWSAGFLGAVLAGLTRLLLSDYRRLRQRLKLTCYSQADMVRLLRRAGFTGKRRQPNFGFNQGRMTFTALPTQVNLQRKHG